MHAPQVTPFDELARLLKQATGNRQPAPPVDLIRLANLVEYTPEDMTATVQAGKSLAELQLILSQHHQWLPLDPPDSTLTIGSLLDSNRSGPRRLGYGLARDYLIGIKVVLATGEIIKAGGKVVKNVAGYDLCKLFIGARGTLGVIVEATFKVLPRPEAAAILELVVPDFQRAREIQQSILASSLRPCAFELFRRADAHPLEIEIGFEGTTEEVQSQVETVTQLGFNATDRTQFQSQSVLAASAAFQTVSVQTTDTCTQAAQITGPFVARFGNGIIYHRDARPIPAQARPVLYEDRVKNLFDPAGIFPKLAS